MENLSGKSFRLFVGPTGRIEERKGLEEILKQAAKSAFRSRSSERIKEPDMIGDFMATQMFLWNSISSIKEPRKGVETGQTWQSQVSLPSPILDFFKSGRDVIYKLESVKDTNDGRLAVINSEYTPSKTLLPDWIVPYEGSFLLSGPFGLYTNFQIIEFAGKGSETFNIDQGKIISDVQDYSMTVSAALSLIPVKIRITVKQRLSMQLLN